MTNQKIIVLGSWITAIGTIASAISSTPLRSLKGEEKKRWDEISQQLDFGGNAFQAIGNIVDSAFNEEFTLEVAGGIIQASGNVTVLFSILTRDNEVKKVRINIAGNAQQAFGGLLAAIDEIHVLIEEGGDSLGIIGNTLQSIGNTLQSIAGLYDLEIIRGRELIDEDGEEEGETEIEFSIESETNTISQQIKMNADISELLTYSGSWIQAAGSIISAVSEQKELVRLRNLEKKLDETKKKKKTRRTKKKKKQSDDQVILKNNNSTDEYSQIKKKS